MSHAAEKLGTAAYFQRIGRKPLLLIGSAGMAVTLFVMVYAFSHGSLDPQGNLVSGAVAWATLNPGVAVVDGSGLVTATGPGTTTISGVFQGVGGTATLAVTQ